MFKSQKEYLDATLLRGHDPDRWTVTDTARETEQSDFVHEVQHRHSFRSTGHLEPEEDLVKLPSEVTEASTETTELTKFVGFFACDMESSDDFPMMSMILNPGDSRFVYVEGESKKAIWAKAEEVCAKQWEYMCGKPFQGSRSYFDQVEEGKVRGGCLFGWEIKEVPLGFSLYGFEPHLCVSKPATIIQALVRGFLERRSMYMLECEAGPHSLKEALNGRHRLLVLHLTGYKGPHDWLAPYPEAHDSRLNADALQVEFYKFFDEIDPGMRGCFGLSTKCPGDYWYDIEVSRMHDAEKRQGELDAVIRANPGAPTKYLAATLAKHGWNLDVPKFEAWNEKVLFMPPLSTPVCIVCLFDPKGEKWGEEGGEFECGACRDEPCFQWNATSNEDECGSFPVKGTHLSTSDSECTCKQFIKKSTDSLIRCFKEHRLITVDSDDEDSGVHQDESEELAKLHEEPALLRCEARPFGDAAPPRKRCLETLEYPEPRSPLYSPPRFPTKWVNACLECGVDMGRGNPRQLCGKTQCDSEPFRKRAKY